MGYFSILLFLMFCGAAVGKKNINRNNNIAQADKIWQSKKAQCTVTTCAMYVIPEGYNCVNKCLSPKCYDEYYAASPLEDGEIDGLREREFTKCVRQEQRDLNKSAQKPR